MNITRKTVTRQICRNILALLLILGWSGNAMGFENFEIDLTKNPVGDLPAGVTQISYPSSNHTASYNGTHGWCWYAIQFDVNGPVTISLGGCQFTNDGYEGYVLVDDETDTNKRPIRNKTTYCYHQDGSVGTYKYEGGPATLKVFCGQYCPYIKVEGQSTPDAPTVEGIYDRTVTSVEELKAALTAANGNEAKRFKIFIKNGMYNLGTAINTPVKNYTTLIGESRDGVIIKNTPKEEGIWSSATLRTGSNVIMQNLTLQCVVQNSGNAERGTSLYDEGTNNIYKNIRLLGRQDVYYSDDNTNSYFEDCEIHGTVDFICGSGNAWFERCKILLVNRDNDNVIVAPRSNSSATEYKGYFLNNCVIDNAEGANMNGKYYLGRGWSGSPKSVFANCTYNIAYKTDRGNGDKDGYDRQKWAGANPDPDPAWDNSGMTQQEAALTNAATTMGSIVSAVQPLSAPANILLTNGQLTWSEVEGATAYAIYNGTTRLATVESTITTYDVSQTTATAFFSVSAISADGITGTPAIIAKADVSAEEAAQNTPEGWEAVQLPNIYINTTITPTLQSGDDADNAAAINQAIAAANAAGGGKVIIPEGTWLSGPLTMKSNVVLHLSKNATLKLLPFSKYPANNGEIGNWKNDYKEKMFIGGGNQAVNDIIIEGEGETSLIDGQGLDWWKKIDDPQNVEKDKFERRPPLIRIKSGARQLFRNFKMQNSPGTNLTVGASGNVNNVTVHDITISNPPSKAPTNPSHNTDGIPVWGNNVNIYRCIISTGDDNIVCDDHAHHVHAWNIKCGYGHGMSVGSNTIDTHDIIYEDITFNNTLNGFRLKSNRKKSGNSQSGSNGAVRNIVMRNSMMSGVADPIIINSWYGETAPAPEEATAAEVTATTPEFKDITFDHITVTDPGSGYTGEPHQYPVYIYGLPEMKVKNVTFSDCHITSKGKGMFLAYIDGIHFEKTTINEKSNKDESSVLQKEYEVENLTGLDIDEPDPEPSEPTYTDRLLYKTKFWEWTEMEASASEQTWEAKTKDNQALTFSFTDTHVAPTATHEKFTNAFITRGYLMAIKNGNSVITTTSLNHVHKVKYVHASTGNDRGWGLRVKGDGDEDWVTLSTTTCEQAGSEVEVIVDRSNVQLQFYNLNPSQNAYMTSVEIWDRDVTRRTFKNFKIDFRGNTEKAEEYIVTLPESGNLQNGVKIGGTWNDSQHGYAGATIEVPVDGPVKFTIGGCQYSNEATVTINGKTTHLNTKSAGCDNGFGAYNHYITYTYNSYDPATLYFNLGNYCPYFFAETSALIPAVTVSYYDQKGLLIKEETLNGNAPINLSNAPSISVSGQEVFRGWFNDILESAEKIKDGTPVTEDLALYAKVTLREVAENGTQWDYDLRKKNWNQEDHDLISITGGSYHGSQHGWAFFSGGTITLDVSEMANVEMGLCVYSNEAAEITVTDADGNEIARHKAKGNLVGKDDADKFAFKYEGGKKTTLTFTIPSNSYIHYVKVLNADPVMITFDNTNEMVEGKVPDPIQANLTTNKAIMPKAWTIYRDEWTITGWTDGTNTYDLGEDYVFSKSVTLKPKMRKNENTITDTNQEVTVKWDFDHDNAPAIQLENDEQIAVYSSQGEIIVDATTKEKIDFPMYIDASEGKFDNTDKRVNDLTAQGSDKEAPGGQINDGTVLTVPAVYGMKVILHASDKVDTEYGNNHTLFGDGDTEANVILTDASSASEGPIYTAIVSEDKKTLTLTYTGDATKANIKFVKTGSAQVWGFFTDVTIKYPVLPNVISENIIANPDATLFPNEKAVNAGEVTIVRKSELGSHINTGKRHKVGDVVTVTATPEYGYEVTGFKVKNGDTITDIHTDAENTNKKSVDFTVVEGITTIEVTYTRKPMKKLCVYPVKAADGKVVGDITLTPNYSNFFHVVKDADNVVNHVESWFLDGTDVTLSAEAISGWVIDKWSDKAESDGQDFGHQNTYTLTFNPETGDHQDVYVHFVKGKLGSVTFVFNQDDVWGEEDADPTIFNGAYSMEPMNYENVVSFTIPTNYTIFKRPLTEGATKDFGYSLDHWVSCELDEKTQKYVLTEETGEIYELGKTYSFREEDEELFLMPIFRENPESQLNRTNNPVIRYDFGRNVKTYHDPTADIDKKVCAQHINLGANQKTFWTTQVFVEVLHNGKVVSHTRDVTLWCDTGEKGFINNDRIAEWCAFGPGTTFTFASGKGTKISMMTYSPITTTTIDGHVPTLDEERTRQERDKYRNEHKGEANVESVVSHMYVYSYTTENSTLRLPIVIGDDYSYYKWIETATLAANMVYLHINVDDKARGAITKVTTTSDKFEEEQLEDGGYAFQQGNRTAISFHRNFGFEFDKIIDPDKVVNGEPLAVLQMNDDGTVQMVEKKNATTTETVRPHDNNPNLWGYDDSDPTKETVFVLRKIEPEEDGEYTRYEVEYNTTIDRNLIICFKPKPTYYVTYSSGQLAEGAAPEAQWLEKGEKFTIPHNSMLYYKGNTLKYWVDDLFDHSKGKDDPDNAAHIYKIGETYTLQHNWGTTGSPDYNLRLTPVFEVNEFTIGDLVENNTNGVTATWKFARRDGAPTIAFERNKGVFVTQIYDGERWADIRLQLDANDRFFKDGVEYENTPENKEIISTATRVNGKFNNTANKDRIQINPYSRIIFPSTPGCTVKLTGTSAPRVKIGDAQGQPVSANSVYTVTFEDVDGTVMEFIKDDNKKDNYCIDFSVTYKQQSSHPDLSSLEYYTGSDVVKTLNKQQIDEMMENDGYITLEVEPWLHGDKILDLRGNVEGGGYAEATKATVSTLEASVTVKTSGGIIVKTYPVQFVMKKPGSAPQFKRFIVNGKARPDGKKDIVVDDVAKSLVIQIEFDRPMAAYKGEGAYAQEFISNGGNALMFKHDDVQTIKQYPQMFPQGYFDLILPKEKEYFKDIYGVPCAEDLSIRVIPAELHTTYNTSTFDFIVGRDGNINQAIDAANKNNKEEGKRYYIFVPDGEYELTGNEDIAPDKYTMTSDGVWPANNDGNPVTYDEMAQRGFKNGRTVISKPNVSIIGQSRDGVKIWNKPHVEGISFTSTIHLNSKAKDFYAEELTLENRFDYKKSIAGQLKHSTAAAARGVVLWDQAERTVMKDVALKSWQDTYYSNNQSASFRGYFEKCKLYGVVDWVCGDGDIWFEKCDMILRERSGNNLAAPRTNVNQLWGYVFKNCKIIPEEGAVRDSISRWSLARPWGDAKDSPACTFLNTNIDIMPRIEGWGTMGSGSILRFHEYNTMDLNDNPQSLGTRSLAGCSPGAGSEECVLNTAQAERYTVQAAMGGVDAFEPNALCRQIDAKNAKTEDMDLDNHVIWDAALEVDGDKLKWNNHAEALCYFIFKWDEDSERWIYKDNITHDKSTTQTTYSLANNQNLGFGKYCVRAANQYGGLGAATAVVEYKFYNRYTLEIKQLNDLTDADGTPMGWSTICLDYNAKTPDGIKVYAATAHGETSSTEKVDDYYMTLTEVDVLNANEGYIVYGPSGKYVFTATSNKNLEHATILKGNPTDEPISAVNISCYVMANKTQGLGFYKYTGTSLAPKRAWLPQDMVVSKDPGTQTQNAKPIRFIFAEKDDLTTALRHLLYGTDSSASPAQLYNLSGQRVKESAPGPRGIYISRGRGKKVVR